MLTGSVTVTRSDILLIGVVGFFEVVGRGLGGAVQQNSSSNNNNNNKQNKTRKKEKKKGGCGGGGGGGIEKLNTYFVNYS